MGELLAAAVSIGGIVVGAFGAAAAILGRRSDDRRAQETQLAADMKASADLHREEAAEERAKRQALQARNDWLQQALDACRSQSKPWDGRDRRRR